METWTVILLSVGLAMDAFAVAICKGATLSKDTLKNALKIGLCFGFFQFIMPIIGYYLGSSFSEYADQFDHWIAGGLLLIIAFKMIMESIKPREGEACTPRFDYKELLVLGVATSIDALAVGISIAMLSQNIYAISLTIGVITFIIALLGTLFGRKIGGFIQTKAGIFGGVVLIIIAIKVIVEGLHIL